MLLSLLSLSAFAGESFFGSTFEPTTALLIAHPRQPGTHQLLLADRSLTCEQAVDLELRHTLLHDGTKLVVASFRPAAVGAVSTSVAAIQSIDSIAGGRSATIEALPNVPGPGGRVRFDLTALEPKGEVGVRLHRVVDFSVCAGAF